jgi:hypothetical protein
MRQAHRVRISPARETLEIALFLVGLLAIPLVLAIVWP